MELLIKLFALCIVGAVLAMLLREQKQVLAYFVVLGLVLAALPPLLGSAAEILSFFRVLMELSALPGEVFQPMLKTVAIALVTRIGTSLCKDAESDTAAALLEIARLAQTDPEALHASPRTTPIGRPDEVTAARHPVVRG